MRFAALVWVGPSCFSVFFARPVHLLARERVHRSPTAVRASDHLPLTAEVVLR